MQSVGQCVGLGWFHVLAASCEGLLAAAYSGFAGCWLEVEKKHDLIQNTVALENTASKNIAFESRSIFLALEHIALEKENF
eukprot:COSAG02_NODE_64146_length_261_cov_0.672840_1_plen_80_part_01